MQVYRVKHTWEKSVLIHQEKRFTRHNGEEESGHLRRRLKGVGVVIALLSLGLLTAGWWIGERSTERKLADYPVMLWRYIATTGATLKSPTFQIDIKYKHIYVLQQQRQRALEQGRVLENEFVPAKMQYQGVKIPIEVRLKPGPVDSLRTEQWAYQVEIKNDDRPFGMKRFSLYVPEQETFLQEHAWLTHLREAGLLARRTEVVQVAINGSAKQKYVLEDEFSKEWLKADSRPEGLFLKYTEIDGSTYSVEATRDGHIDKYLGLRRQRESAIALLQGFLAGTYTAEQAFDAEAMGTFLAIAQRWPTAAALQNSQTYFYYNPLTTKLEPVGFHYSPNAAADAVSAESLNELTVRLLQNPTVAAHYRVESKRVSEPEYWAQVEPKIVAALNEKQAVLKSPFQTESAEIATTPNPAQNLRSVPLPTKANSLSIKALVPTAAQAKSPVGQGRTLRSPTLSNLLAQHPFLRWDKRAQALRIKPGNWSVKGDLITPMGTAVTASAETQLRFESDALFIARGPLNLVGMARRPVVLAPLNQSWGGLEVWQANERSQQSVLKQVTIKQTKGGTSFYNSPLLLFSSRFMGSQARDGLKLFHSDFLIADSLFQSLADDAIDTEASDGTVDSSRFDLLGGDGVDISQSEVTVQNVEFSNVADKGISAGQNSELTVNNVAVRDGAIAISVIDGSTAQLNSVEIKNMLKAGITAYSERLGFSPVTVNARNITQTNTEQPALAQNRSQIILNGQKIVGNDQSTYQLRAEQILSD